MKRILRSGALALVLAAGVSHAQLKSRVYGKGALKTAPAEVVIVNEFGVYPQKIVRPEGPFLLYIENRLEGQPGRFSLSLDSVSSELAGLETKADRQHDSKLLDLEPGKYRIRFQRKPEFTLTIEIQATKN